MEFYNVSFSELAARKMSTMQVGNNKLEITPIAVTNFPKDQNSKSLPWKPVLIFGVALIITLVIIKMKKTGSKEKEMTIASPPSQKIFNPYFRIICSITATGKVLCTNTNK